MNLPITLSHAATLPKGITSATLFANLEAEFGRHSGGVKLLKTLHGKWSEGNATSPKADALFESLASSSRIVKPAAPAAPITAKATPAQVLEAATNPAARAAAVAGLQQSVAARLGLAEIKTCTRADFATLTPAQKSEFSKAGGRITTPEPIAPAKLAPGAKIATRAQFARLAHSDKLSFFRNGGQLKD